MVFKNVIISLRPRQWIKNILIFAALVFSQNLINIHLLSRAFIAFLLFCAISGATYLFNDLMDIERDKMHPLKKERPLPSGRLSRVHAWITLTILTAVSFVSGYFLSAQFALVLLLYLILQIGYSTYLKKIVIVDVLALAIGFVLRVAAGAVAIDVEISSWLFVCTILLSLFIALGKRRHELLSLQGNATEHRQVLSEYSIMLLDQMIPVATASTVIAYILYTISDATIKKIGDTRMLYTIPFVLYGIFRYLYLIHKKDAGGNPETMLTADLPLLINCLLWAGTASVLIYFF